MSFLKANFYGNVIGGSGGTSFVIWGPNVGLILASNGHLFDISVLGERVEGGLSGYYLCMVDTGNRSIDYSGGFCHDDRMNLGWVEAIHSHPLLCDIRKIFMGASLAVRHIYCEVKCS